ncbi:hypothetical protein Rwratislav_24826 [Rhodococcus wratislaviensis IFP 2016]|nr:hypothetical protein Rwratislav_24826 [Rhodococcus wratislaviensis IFP 2016]
MCVAHHGRADGADQTASELAESAAADHDHRRTLGPRDERRGSVLMRQLGADLDRSAGVPCPGDFDGCGELMLCPGLQLLSMTRARRP